MFYKKKKKKKKKIYIYLAIRRISFKTYDIKKMCDIINFIEYLSSVFFINKKNL